MSSKALVTSESDEAKKFLLVEFDCQSSCWFAPKVQPTGGTISELEKSARFMDEPTDESSDCLTGWISAVPIVSLANWTLEGSNSGLDANCCDA